MNGCSTRQLEVLVVDDDPGVREAMGLVLTERGAHVTQAATFAEARDTLATRSFAMVLTDLRLPSGTEGLVVARLARQTAPNAKVVLFSGSDLEVVSEEAAAAGVDELLSKPLSLDVLARLLTDLGREAPDTAPRRADNHLTDAQGQALLEAFAAGCRPALERVVEAYRPMLFSVFLRWFRLQAEDAEDLFQEVMLQLVLKAEEIRNVRTWLLGTAINQAKKRIRCLIRERSLAERYLENLELSVPEDTNDIRELLLRGMSRLRPFDGRLLALIYIRGLSYQETADFLERPIGSIGPLRGRALARLSRVIAELESPPQSKVA